MRGFVAAMTAVTIMSLLSCGHLGRRSSAQREKTAKLEQGFAELDRQRDLLTLLHLREPSGLAPSRDGRAIAVHDELEQVFILHTKDLDDPREDRLPFATEAAIPLDFDAKGGIRDLEGIAYDGEKWYFAMSSHREIDDRNVFRLVRFSIDWERRTSIDYTISATSAYLDRHDFVVGLARSLRDAGLDVKPDPDARRFPDVDKDTKAKVAGRKWHSKGKAPHRYAVELEGIAYRREPEELLIGVRFPLSGADGTSGEALLLRCPIDRDASGVPSVREPSLLQTLDLKGKYNGATASYGISDLAYDPATERLYVAANPPGKASTDVPEDAGRYTGRSLIYRFDLDPSSRNQRFVPHREGPYRVGEPGTKLEGLAVVGDDLWLSYEADRPVFRKYRISDLRDHTRH